ncbi:MAG TPA: glycosyltransferase family 4 protein [Vicinamibacteria bacterium]|nr:glycosyltransferase family 4 protein [Vicinamibacteria bacterium]
MTGPRRRVHQVMAALSYGDAVSNDALAIQAHLQAAGFDSEIFAEHAHPRMAGRCRPLWRYREVSSPETVCLFHFAIGSGAGRLVFASPDRLVARYHNITPPELLAPFLPHLARQCEQGRRELRAFAARAELGLGVSEFNRRELEEAGYARTGVVPLLLDLDAFASGGVSPVVRGLFADGRRNVLFVGRIIPNKRIEDLLRVFAFYQRALDPSSRLLLVGDHWGYEPYLLFLEAMARELGAQDVIFTGQVEDDELRALYSVASVYVSLSEHEGFCAPLLEAMAFGVPVVAYDAGAVAETLAGAGVLLRDKTPDTVAALLHQVVADPALRGPVLAGQERRLARARDADFGSVLLSGLGPVLAPRS